MKEKDIKRLRRLAEKWATQNATAGEILECMQLERKRNAKAAKLIVIVTLQGEQAEEKENN